MFRTHQFVSTTLRKPGKVCLPYALTFHMQTHDLYRYCMHMQLLC